jgi:RNA recognition motif-containing protein
MENQAPEVENSEILEVKVNETSVSDQQNVDLNSSISSEFFKLEVKNLPNNFGISDFKKFLQRLNLKYVKIKSPNNGKFAFVTFVDQEAREEARKALNGAKYKGRDLEAIVELKI